MSRITSHVHRFFHFFGKHIFIGNGPHVFQEVVEVFSHVHHPLSPGIVKEASMTGPVATHVNVATAFIDHLPLLVPNPISIKPSRHRGGHMTATSFSSGVRNAQRTPNQTKGAN